MSGDLGDYEKKEVVCGKARAKNMLSVLAFEIFEVSIDIEYLWAIYSVSIEYP